MVFFFFPSNMKLDRYLSGKLLSLLWHGGNRGIFILDKP